MSPIKERLDRIDRFRSALAAAQTERHLRRETVEVPGGIELAWVLHERQVMLGLVNADLTAAGRAPVEESAIDRVEHGAQGHSDYTAKYALGCALLVEGER